MTTSNENLQNDRVDLESKVLAAAFKQSIDLGDSEGADFAHKQLFQLLRANRTTEYLMARPKPALAEIPDLGDSSEISSTVEPPGEPSLQAEQFEPPIDVRAEEPEQQADAPVSSQDEAVLDLARLFAADALAEEPSNGGNGVQIQQFDPSIA